MVPLNVMLPCFIKNYMFIYFLYICCRIRICSQNPLLMLGSPLALRTVLSTNTTVNTTVTRRGSRGGRGFAGSFVFFFIVIAWYGLMILLGSNADFLFCVSFPFPTGRITFVTWCTMLWSLVISAGLTLLPPPILLFGRASICDDIVIFEGYLNWHTLSLLYMSFFMDAVFSFSWVLLWGHEYNCLL